MRRTRAPQPTTPPEIDKPDEQWRQELTRQQYDVLRRGHTETAFTGRYLYAKGNGSYCCAGCGNELFRSDAKFASGTGWPSFVQPGSEGRGWP
jgi:peptide-methionine (R)-S-oxide reductase